MTWGKVDDKLWGSPKWLTTSPRARALWVTALSWCMDQLTDGRVPAHVMPILGGTRKDVAELVRVGFWHPAGHECEHERCPRADDGWVFHDWLDFQPSREQVLADRAAAADRQKRARERAAERRATAAKPSRRDSRRDSRRRHGVSHGPPDPTRPDP